MRAAAVVARNRLDCRASRKPPPGEQHDALTRLQASRARTHGKEAPAEPGQEVRACEALPLAVRGQELRGVRRLGRAAEECGAELDQPKVADQPELVVSEPLKPDDAARPRAEPALPLEPLGDLARVQFAQPLELDRPAQTDDRRGFPGREPEALQLHGRATREAFRRRRDAKTPSVSHAQRISRRSIFLASDEVISWPQTARTSACVTEPRRMGRLPGSALSVRPSIGSPANRSEELGVVGLERKRRQQLLQRLLRVRSKLDAPVGLLPCAGPREPVLDREQADEDAPVEPSCGVARPDRGVAQRERAAGPEGRLDHGGNITGDERSAQRPRSRVQSGHGEEPT